jgi:hypothetical protein
VWVFLLLTAIGDVPAADAANDLWAGRSGEAQALADIAARRPLTLFYRGIAGERIEMRTPGLRDCDPERYDVPKNYRSRFVSIGPEYSESVQYSAEELARMASATRFAKDYNRTIFRMRRSDVLKICPKARPDSR